METNKDYQKIIRNILRDIRVDMADEFDKNFERQAFFNEAWERRKSPTRPGDRALVNTGGLRRSIRVRETDSSIIFYTDHPAAAINNEGGDIVVTQRMKMFFRHKFYESQGGFTRKKRDNKKIRPLSDGGFYAWTSAMKLSPEAEFWRLMALKKVGTTIHIPKRKFLGTGPEVEKAVRAIVEENLEEYFNVEFKIMER